MRFSRCQRVFMRGVVAALALGATVASVAAAKPRPSKPGGFRLFASATTILVTNRVQCRIASDGQVCATGSTTVGGGIWPRGTADQYVFGSGINIAGVIEPGDKSVNGFAGNVSLSVTGLPNKTSASFSPQVVAVPANGSASSTLTVSTQNGGPTGTFTLTITGTSGPTSHSQNVTLTLTR